MASFNQLQLIGRLGKDPETRYTTQGTGSRTLAWQPRRSATAKSAPSGTTS